VHKLQKTQEMTGKESLDGGTLVSSWKKTSVPTSGVISRGQKREKKRKKSNESRAEGEIQMRTAPVDKRKNSRFVLGKEKGPFRKSFVVGQHLSYGGEKS